MDGRGGRAFARRVGVGILLAATSVATSCAGSEPEPVASREPAPDEFSIEESPREQKKPDGSQARAPDPVKPPKEKDEPVAPQPEPRPGVPVTVTRVVDGDTIEVERGTRTLDVRLLGVDTPETVHPSVPVECYGPRASSFTAAHLSGESVRLEFDQERRDHYGRVLGYVWLDGTLFNRTLVLRGFAEVEIYEPNDEYEGRLLAAESRARSSGRGLWDACGGADKAAAPPSTEDAAPPSGDGKCDPNYAGACVPVYPPDIDCPDAGATNFRSTGSDPHGFDGDGDGVACEG